MSYILDALRKADAERERGHVPGIHAQPVFTGSNPSAAQRGPTPWGWVAAVVIGVLAIAAIAWFWLAGAPRNAVPVAAAPAPAATPAPAPVPAPALTAAPPPAIAAAPTPRTRAEPARKVAAAPSTPRPEPEGAAGPTPTTAPPAAAASAARIYAVAELPAEIRNQLPQVAVGGSAYSSKPANRILIVNGQVLHEGERIAPELTLQQIKVKSAVLAFRGYRYELAY